MTKTTIFRYVLGRLGMLSLTALVWSVRLAGAQAITWPRSRSYSQTGSHGLRTASMAKRRTWSTAHRELPPRPNMMTAKRRFPIYANANPV